MSSVQFDSVVVGGGVMGFSAALALAKAGRNTVLLEQFPSPHTRGSSTGQSRIIRAANFGAPELDPLMAAAFQRWRDIEQESGKQLFIPSPMLCIGSGEHLERMRSSIRSAGSEPLESNAATINRECGYNIPDDQEVFADPLAGVLLADQCLIALKTLYEKHGGTVLDRWPVSRVETQGLDNCVTVHGPEGATVQAARAVICAGSWTGPLLEGLGLRLPLTPMKVGVFYWRQRRPELPSRVFIVTNGTDSWDVYGLPSIEYPGLVKVVAHGGIPCDPDNRDLTDCSASLAATAIFVKRFLPCLHPEPVVTETCMYTNTPDEEMILDRLPGCTNVVFGCGFSGTGFKVAPVVGRILCQMATEQQLDHDVSRFAARRFTKFE